MDKQMVDFYTFDNKIYIVLKQLDYNDQKYVFLANEMDNGDDMIRRVSGSDLLPLESDEEFLAVVKKMFS